MSAGLGRAPEGGAIDADQPKLLAVSEDPLEIVEQAPVQIAGHRNAVGDRMRQWAQSGGNELGAQAVIGRVQPMLGDQDRQAGLGMRVADGSG